jgi:hypothetical protein
MCRGLSKKVFERPDETIVMSYVKFFHPYTWYRLFLEDYCRITKRIKSESHYCLYLTNGSFIQKIVPSIKEKYYPEDLILLEVIEFYKKPENYHYSSKF